MGQTGPSLETILVLKWIYLDPERAYLGLDPIWLMMGPKWIPHGTALVPLWLNYGFCKSLFGPVLEP